MHPCTKRKIKKFLSKKCEKARQKKKEKKPMHAQEDEKNTFKMKSIVFK